MDGSRSVMAAGVSPGMSFELDPYSPMWLSTPDPPPSTRLIMTFSIFPLAMVFLDDEGWTDLSSTDECVEEPSPAGV